MKFGLRKPSWRKSVGAWMSQWKRALMRLLLPGYGRKGVGWWTDPEKAAYNWWYRRTTFSLWDIFPKSKKKKRTGNPDVNKPLGAFGHFMFSLLAIALLPIGLSYWGAKSGQKKIKQHREAKSANSGTHSNGKKRKNSNTANQESRHGTGIADEKPHTQYASNEKNKAYTRSKSVISDQSKKKPIKQEASEIQQDQAESLYIARENLFAENSRTPSASKPVIVEEPKEPDENTPKSTPKGENDQYIRKRMIIAGSYYCEQSTLSKLSIGTYFDVQPEPNNPHDKDAVVLLYEGEKIGYIAKQDSIPFITCLKLRRNIYGVITNIISEDGRTKYEYETWFTR